jgi:hypothetical protein
VSAAFVNCGWHVHRIPRPTLVTIAKRPSYRGAGQRHYTTDLISEKEKYFNERGLTRFRKISPTRLGKNGLIFGSLLYASFYDESGIQDR